MIPIGERLKLARLRARLSQRELARRVGVTAMSISKYENNVMVPGAETLVKLAQALDVRVEFLLRQAPSLRIEPVYRRHKRMGPKAQDAVKAQIQDWLERYLLVESLLPDDVRVQMPQGFPRPVRTLDDTERAATALREAWQLGSDPIDNLTELLEERGIKIGLVEGAEDFDACTFLYDDRTPVIAVNQNRPADRQRFDLAHELGHLVMRVAGGLDEEKAAHRFAAAFLVPKEIVYVELGRSRSHLDLLELLELKEKYGMSVAAWAYRAQDLSILPDSAARQLWRQLSARGWRKQEPLALPAETPSRMYRLVRRLVAEGIISEARAAELMGQRITLFPTTPEEARALHH
ncbi:MAG: XRE family transcriptional regulator [Chloroflexota bacterium]|jgi:Zn-dependent peptidase ImmA (M78 family)/DNA-binding XRE family transcriptional regulator